MRRRRLIVCVLVPRFALRVAAGGPLGMEPLALGPEPGGPPLVGEPNAAAATFGVRVGMRMGEALARCPRLRLLTPDPGAVSDAAEELLRRLEALGAAVESLAPGHALFAADGLLRLHGGRARLLAAVGGVLPAGGRVGAGPGRFTARVAAERARPGRPVLVEGDDVARFLGSLPVERVVADPDAAHELSTLGIVSAAMLAALPLPAVADRFGAPAIRAWRLCHGEDEAYVVPRTPPQPLREALHLEEPAGDEPTLRWALASLLERLLARPERRGREVRSLALSADLAEGGSWRRAVALREATADPRVLRDALLPHLRELPAPVERMVLEAGELDAGGGRQEPLERSPETLRRERAAEAARQVRAALGEGCLWKVVEVAPHSRVPEARDLLVPFEG